MELNEHIMNNIKYPYDSLIVNQPVDSKYYSTEAEDDETWIWAGFVKAGKYSLKLTDPMLGNVEETIFVGTRSADL